MVNLAAHYRSVAGPYRTAVIDRAIHFTPATIWFRISMGESCNHEELKWRDHRTADNRFAGVDSCMKDGREMNVCSGRVDQKGERDSLNVDISNEWYSEQYKIYLKQRNRDEIHQCVDELVATKARTC